MKLNKIHKKIFGIALKNIFKNYYDFTPVELIIQAKKGIKGINYNRKYSIEYYIGELIEWKYLKLMTVYDDIGEREFTVVDCNEKNYKIKCELKLKNKYGCRPIG